MTTYSWTTNRDGDWNTGTLWTPTGVPNSATDDVTIDAPTTNTAYTVTIAAGQTETVHSLTMNGTNALGGTNNPNGYFAAKLELDGTLAFAAGSAGGLDGSLQTIVHTAGGTSAEIVNGGTLNGFIQVEGTLLITGTNGLYITNDIQALSGTVTMDTSSIAAMTGTTLFDGIFDSKGPGAVIDFGGALQHLAPDIVTIEGPQPNPGGWTELTYGDPTAVINEWNGTAYVPVESTLKEIDGGGTVDVLAGRNFTTTNTLTVTHLGLSDGAGLLNLQAGTVTTGGITINGGIVQGFGTIVGGMANNGTLIARAGTLDLTGALTGTGVVQFDRNAQEGTVDAAGATLSVVGVAAGQTISMTGKDRLAINAPGSFAGTIAAGVGDVIVLTGTTVTSASVTGGRLVAMNGSQQVASLALSGNYAGEQVTASGSTLTFAAAGGGTPTSSVGEFDPAYYLANNPDVAAAGVNPEAHYDSVGWREGRNPDPYFNTDYYLRQNPDVAAAGINPLLHYEQSGWQEGRDPSINFSTKAYLTANPDVAAAHIDPLMHYLEAGRAEGRMNFIAQPHGTGPQDPLVDSSYYFSHYSDVAAAGVDPTAHYDASGWKEGRSPDAYFDTAYYLQQNPDVAAAGINPLLHYEDAGWKEGRNPSAAFSTSQYLAHNPDVAAAHIDPLVHYLQAGAAEGRAIYSA